MNQYKTPRQFSTTRIFSRTTSTVPNQPQPFLANPNLILSSPTRPTTWSPITPELPWISLLNCSTHSSFVKMDAKAFTIPLMTSLPLNGFPFTSLSALILYPCLILLCSLRTWRISHFSLDNFYKFVPIRHIETNFHEKVAWGKS